MPEQDYKLIPAATSETATALVVEDTTKEVPAPPVSREEFDQLKAERDQLLDRLARLQAEFENARKRSERERLEFRDYATGNVVEQFLPVLDNFELALKSTGSAAATALRRGADRQADARSTAPSCKSVRFPR